MPVRQNNARNAVSRNTAAQQLKVLSSKTVFQGRIFRVDVDRVREPSGVVVQRDVVHHPGSVLVLAVDDSAESEPSILLERQYRYTANDYLWELPSGSINPGETPLSGAKRELLEETGYRARNWSRALSFYPSPGFLDETMSVYLARGLTPGPSQPEVDEFITCVLMPSCPEWSR